MMKQPSEVRGTGVIPEDFAQRYSSLRHESCHRPSPMFNFRSIGQSPHGGLWVGLFERVSISEDPVMAICLGLKDWDV